MLNRKQFGDQGLQDIPEGIFQDVQPLSLPEMAGSVKPKDDDNSSRGMSRRKFDPSELTTTQTQFSPAGVHRHSGGPVVTARLGGKDYLVDGHHKAIEAAEAGKQVPAIHFDADEDPQALWRAARYAQQQARHNPGSQ
jgi:hypothetical protein